MTRVYIAEKPSQGRAIQKAIGAGPPSIPSLSGLKGPPGTLYWTQDGIVICAVGHLLRFREPHEYDEDLKRWSLDKLPMIPTSWPMLPNETPGLKVPERLRAIKKVLTDKSVKEIVIATDAGREGELIARELLEYMLPKTSKAKIYRLWTQSLSENALKKALSSLRPGSSTEGLHHAGKTRQIWDWLEGLNYTRLFSMSCRPYGAGGVISVGRVQTPTLALIVRLQKTIENFVAVKYFEISALASKHGVTLRYAPAEKDRILDRNQAEAIAQEAEGFSGPLLVKTEPKKKGPPPLFDLAGLQKFCSSSKKWTAKATLECAQKLYELGHISYPRTDCTALDPDDKQECINLIMKMAKNPSYHLPSKKTDLVIRPKTFNKKAVEASDHHAIIPTDQIPQGTMDAGMAFMYDQIARRFAAAFLPDWEYLRTTVTMDVNGRLFQAAGNATTKHGWKMLYTGMSETDSDADQDIPFIKSGSKDTLKDCTVVDCQTKPPAPYTEGSLVAAMKKHGIGTQATWANILETLKRRQYIETKNAKLWATTLGVALIELADDKMPSLTDIERTGRMEIFLQSIVTGEQDFDKAKAIVEKTVTEEIQRLKTLDLPNLPMEPTSYGKKSASGPKKFPKRRKPGTQRKKT